MGKQLKIGELKRVVNIDVIFKYTQILKNGENTNVKQIENILGDLSNKTPSREVLIKTKLGFILKELSNRKTLPTKTRSMARDLRSKWKDFHKSQLLLTKKDVKCDIPTNQKRDKAREYIKKSLESIDKDLFESSNSADQFPSLTHRIVSEFEFHIYQFMGVVNESYFCKIEQFMEFLKQNSNHLFDLAFKKTTPETCVLNYLSNN